MKRHKEITIDGLKANAAENMLFKGTGMVSGNNSSRLLMDYKTENPEAYWEILEYTFGKNGLGITHLKLEMGSDINSSSGTEPCVMRSESEKADVTRGAGYQLAADAKLIAPDLTLDMLWWSEPRWVANSKDVYAARYKWYKNTLDAAYEKYGLKFDYVSASRNEREIDAEWIKFFSKALRSERNAPYDYSKIKIVAADEENSWRIADKMIADEKLRDAVDIIGAHYTSRSTENARLLAEKYGKELWFSEGSPPMSYAQGTFRFDSGRSGLSGLNGALDIADRIIMMYPQGRMTMCQFQPVIAAYYDGVCYCYKQFILAKEPWSGHYSLENGFFAYLHFSRFIKKGWAFVDGACFSDGEAGGDGHAVVNSVYSYMTLTDLKTGDYSTVITNTSDATVTYSFRVLNLKKAASQVYVWETRGPDKSSDIYDENYFKNIGEISPEAHSGAYIYNIDVKPYSVVTVSTLSIEKICYDLPQKFPSKALALPYFDDYKYSDQDENYLSSRGGAPRYATDQGGAFEVCGQGESSVLTQIITAETKADEWGFTPDPTTNFGDDRWYNYSVSADVLLEASGAPDKNYAGIGLRYSRACIGASGYWLQLFENGNFALKRNNDPLRSGRLEGFNSQAWTNLRISAEFNTVKCFINGKKAIEYTAESEPLLGAGRAAFFCSYNKNRFRKFAALPSESGESFITRFDDTDPCVKYSGDWRHTTSGGYKIYKRTCSDGSVGSEMSVDFNGSGFAITGENQGDTIISVIIDDKIAEKSFKVLRSEAGEIAYFLSGLKNEDHKVKIKVTKGVFNVDSLEILGAKDE